MYVRGKREIWEESGIEELKWFGALSEIVGYKSGLALTRTEIVEHLPEYEPTLMGDDDAIIRLRAEDYEEILSTLLYRLGCIASPPIVFPGVDMFHKYKEDPKKYELYESVLGFFLEMFPDLEKRSPEDEPIDLTPFLVEVEKRYKDTFAMKIALEYIGEIEQYLYQSPWAKIRRHEWVDIKELSDLFRSESLDTYYGKFFDQRFIDYLNRNFNSIDRINWRKFEALTCEFFDRLGFYVEIGTGRNDDSIDARIWPKKADRNLPPTILVQCKREKKKIGKIVAKALWADVDNEGAKSGLIVTTNALSPGAVKVCTARSYPIKQANRKTLKQWIKAMRSPNTGVFMGE